MLGWPARQSSADTKCRVHGAVAAIGGYEGGSHGTVFDSCRWRTTIATGSLSVRQEALFVNEQRMPHLGDFDAVSSKHPGAANVEVGEPAIAPSCASSASLGQEELVDEGLSSVSWVSSGDHSS